MSKKEKSEFLLEAEVMKEFSKPHHPNVLRLLGVMTKKEPLMIVTEYCGKGNFAQVLRSSRPLFAGGVPKIKLSERVQMTIDIVRGMIFLSSNDFVHRDLSARNCFVNDDMVVKVANLALSKNIQGPVLDQKDGHMKFPVRWMAPEVSNPFLFLPSSL